VRTELSNPGSWAIIFTLMIMEGLLSADNALVLAMMVKHLPEKQQKKALTYGIWGAYIFRFIAIGIGTLLIKIWWVKLIASGYLIKMSLEFFLKKNKDGEEEVKVINKGFWATVATVELMDIAFSIDSVTSAFGISSEVWVLFLGAIFGIVMMRGVAKIFVALIEKIPELEGGAYTLIFIIGVKMILELIHIEIHEIVFFGLLVIVFGATFILHNIRKSRNLNTK
jgi:YkoY family integral membrane protein